MKRRDDVEKAMGLNHKNTQKFRGVIEEEGSELDWKDRIEDFGDQIPVLNDEQICKLFEARC